MADTEIFEKPQELPDEIKKESEPIKVEDPEPVQKPVKKKGKHKKPMSDERRKQLRENLRRGRETSLKNRQAN